MDRPDPRHRHPLRRRVLRDGSLDDETLEEVLEVLDELRSYSRTVGVVSHVADLRRRIPTQMQVRKSQDGSTVKAMATAPAY